MTHDSYTLLRDYAFRLLSGRNYAEAELAKKLTRRGKKLKLADVHVAVKKVIKRLKELKYVDDDRILADYFEYRLKHRPQGKFLFMHEMHRRGIPLEKAEKAWNDRGIEELPLALALIESRSARLSSLPKAARSKKIAQILMSRGFSSETVWQAKQGGAVAQAPCRASGEVF